MAQSKPVHSPMLNYLSGGARINVGRRVLYLICVSSWLTVGPAAFAQTSSLQGIITDQSGAVAPAVQVTLSQLDTGTTLQTVTNDAGLYSFPTLAIGRYVVKAIKRGFEAVQSAELTLRVGQIARADLTLHPGNITEHVTVEAAAPPLDTESTMAGQVVNNRTIVNLPLNGRNYLQLAQLTSGVGPAIGSRQTSEGSFSASGQHGWQINVQLDGMDNTSRASGGQLGYEAQAVKPSVDAVAEFRVVTNNFSAEYGYRMGGTVLVSMKSGTNQFHGSAFEFLRNSKLDATNFFANLNGSDKPVFKRNQFGGTAGGPIIKDKTFFFGSYEGTRIRNGNSFVSTVPTLEMRQGNFSQVLPIYDPATSTGTTATLTRQQFPGNVIPMSRWDPVATKVMSLYPLPVDNTKTVNNYFYSPVEKDTTDSYDGKIDHNMSESLRLSGRYSVRKSYYLQPGPLPLPADGGLWTTVDLLSNNFVASATKTFSPTLTNELRGGFSRIRSTLDIPYDAPLYDEFGITNVPKTNDPKSNDHGLTRFTPQGYAELGSRSYWPSFNNLNYFQISDILYNSRGRQTIKAGFDIRRERVLRTSSRFARGQYQFNREFTADPKNRSKTGDGIAELLLGMASGGTLGNESSDDVIAHSVDGFIQDDIHVTRHLTLNLGLRYDVFLGLTFPSGSINKVSNFILNTTATGPGVQFEQTRPRNDGDCGCDQDLNNFAPRLGFAWQATSKTVIRSGFGIIYAQADNIQKQAAIWSIQAPDYTESSFSTIDRIHPLLTLSGGLPAIQLPATAVPGPNLVGISARSPFVPTQYSEQWFFDLQRELPFGLVTTIGYAGNGTHHLSGSIDYNVPSDGPSPIPVAQRRTWPFYTGVSAILPYGNLSYNALTARLEKRFSTGLQFLGAYTWAHTIDNVVEDNNDTVSQGSVDPWNRQLDRANAVNDIRHNFVFSGTYELPFGRGKRWMNRRGFLNAAFGGWQFSGIASLRTGAPFTVTTTGNLTNAGGTDRPNRIGDGALPSDQRSIYNWFDLSAFQVQPQYTYGNSGRNVLFGPGLKNLDLTLGKVFTLTERMNLQFRLESFNATNTPAFGQPNAVLNSPSAGTITSAGDPRRVQLGLKLLW